MFEVAFREHPRCANSARCATCVLSEEGGSPPMYFDLLYFLP
jgi:hypothetical protein